MILFLILSNKKDQARNLAEECQFSEQYYRALVDQAQEYREVLQEMRKTSPEGLELLDNQAIQYFKEGELDEDEIAARLNVPAIYIVILSLIRNSKIPTEKLAPVLDMTKHHIGYLRFLLDAPPPPSEERPEPAPPPLVEVPAPPLSAILPEPTPSPPPPIELPKPTPPPARAQPEPIPKPVVEHVSGSTIEEKMRAAIYARLNYHYKFNKAGPFKIFLVYPDGSEEPFIEITNKERVDINSDFVKHKLTPDRLGKHLKHLKLKPSEIRLLWGLITERMEERLVFDTPQRRDEYRRDD